MILFLKRIVAGLIITAVSLAVPVALFALVFFFPTLTCNGGGAGGNCGEGYMASIPLALLLIPLDILAMVAVGGGLAKLIWPQSSPPPLPSATSRQLAYHRSIYRCDVLSQRAVMEPDSQSGESRKSA